jgi:predicted PurR-regulated permease PerM
MNQQETTAHWAKPLIFVLLALAATYLLGLLLWPFLAAIVTSAVIATLGYPLHVRVERRVPHGDLAALLTTTFVFFLVLVPAFGLSLILLGELRTGIDRIAGLATGARPATGLVAEWLDRAADYLGLEAAGFGDAVAEQLRNFLGLLARRTFGFLSGLGGWLVQAGAAIFTLFYLLRDGDSILRTIKWLIPLDETATDRLVDQVRDVIFATVYGNVIVAIVQGGLGGLAFWVLGLPAAALWGTLMAVLALLPLVGAFLVWAPAGVILILNGELARGLLLLAFGAIVISTIDNYLRAVVVGGRAQLHPLVVFFSVLGGLVLFGAVGIFLGPVLFVIAISLLEMARIALGQVPVRVADGTVVQGGSLFEPDELEDAGTPPVTETARQSAVPEAESSGEVEMRREEREGKDKGKGTGQG